MSSRRLRVLQVGKFYPPYRGGMETHLHALCMAIKGDVELSVAVSNTSKATVEELIDGVPVTRLGTLVNIASAPLTPGLHRVMRRSRADIVHIHVPHPVAILAYLTSGFRGRLVVTYHSDIVRQRVLGAAFRPLLMLALSRASAVICTSPNYIESSPVLTRFRHRCHVLPFSIPMDQFAHADPTIIAAIRQQYGPRIVLAVGRLVGYKGFEYLIRAMPQIDGHLVLIGQGPLRTTLHELVRERGLADRVFFLDHVDDTAPYFHAADVFVLPSIARSEAFGLVQLEAMAAGVPVVNTNVRSGVPFVSPDGITGITVPPCDSPALAEAISALLNDPNRRREYGAAGRERVRAQFSVDAMARATTELYEAVMRVEPGEVAR